MMPCDSPQRGTDVKGKKGGKRSNYHSVDREEGEGEHTSNWGKGRTLFIFGDNDKKRREKKKEEEKRRDFCRGSTGEKREGTFPIRPIEGKICSPRYPPGEVGRVDRMRGEGKGEGRIAVHHCLVTGKKGGEGHTSS